MIEPACKYKEQLENLKPIDGDEWYYYHLPLDVARYDMVSTCNGKVIGTIKPLINEAASMVIEYPIMCFSEKHRCTFGKDVMLYTRYIMQKYRKCSFFVIVGSPAECSYDRITKHLGWKIVGIMEKQVKNSKGEWVDIKYYEYVNPDWRPENALI
jgi:hypothetical protein